MKRIVITQPNYIPWKGYFDMMDLADEFVLLDAQYTHRDWRNRNLIKTPIGLQWLTIPVNGSQSKLISEVEITDKDWAQKHYMALMRSYARTEYWGPFSQAFMEFYYNLLDSQYLVDVTVGFLNIVRGLFDIQTPMSNDENTHLRKSERLIHICKERSATHYLTGPAAKAYLDESLFEKEGIKVEWMQYNYPEYPQLYGEFEHGVSILDLLFNVGPDMRYVRGNSGLR